MGVTKELPLQLMAHKASVMRLMGWRTQGRIWRLPKVASRNCGRCGPVVRHAQNFAPLRLSCPHFEHRMVNPLTGGDGEKEILRA